jgi:preprotein translocase subunit Sss1
MIMSVWRSELHAHWAITLSFLLITIAYTIACQFWPEAWRLHWPEGDRLLLRSVLYALVIVFLLFVKLLRHILLRLNQTMPSAKSAAARYWRTVLITSLLIQVMGFLGWGLFLLGDEARTLYIYDVLTVAGLFLHKPNREEYLAICAALAAKQREI